MTDDDILGLNEREREKVFLDMPEPNRWKMMFSMLAFLRHEIPIMKKQQIEFQQELRDVRHARESREQDTNEKIAEFFSKKFDFWVWFRDKVLPTVVTAATLGILYLVFGGKP